MRSGGNPRPEPVSSSDKRLSDGQAIVPTKTTEISWKVAYVCRPRRGKEGADFDIPLAVAEALNPNKPNLDMNLAVAEALSPNKPNLDMNLAVAEALSPNKPNLDMTLAVAEALSSKESNVP